MHVKREELGETFERKRWRAVIPECKSSKGREHGGWGHFDRDGASHDEIAKTGTARGIRLPDQDILGRWKIFTDFTFFFECVQGRKGVAQESCQGAVIGRD